MQESLVISGNGAVDLDVIKGLQSLQIDSDSFLADLIEIFLKTANDRILLLDQHASEGNALLVSREAHSLKSSSGSLGAKGMTALCQQLEDLGESADLSRAGKLISQVKNEFFRVRETLGKIREFELGNV